MTKAPFDVLRVLYGPESRIANGKVAALLVVWLWFKVGLVFDG